MDPRIKDFMTGTGVLAMETSSGNVLWCHRKVDACSLLNYQSRDLSFILPLGRTVELCMMTVMQTFLITSTMG